MNIGAVKILVTGLVAGTIGNGLLGVLFSSPPVRAVLYDPAWQSQLFIAVTPNRNIPVSVAGLIVLSVSHAWLFQVLKRAIPGRIWHLKGIFWGFSIWLLYWVFQEWFIYHTLLGEPLLLNLLELGILLTGSLAEGWLIAFFLARHDGEKHGANFIQSQKSISSGFCS